MLDRRQRDGQTDRKRRWKIFVRAQVCVRAHTVELNSNALNKTTLENIKDRHTDSRLKQQRYA